MVNEIVTPEIVEDAKKEKENIIERAKQIASAIVDDDTCGIAGSFLLEIKKRRDWWSGLMRPAIKSAHEAWKSAIGIEKEIDEPLSRAADSVKYAMGKYQAEQERKRKEEEEKIRAQQRKEKEEAQLKAALEMEKIGNKKAADAILEKPVPIPPPVVLPSAPKQEGISYREVWKYNFTDDKLIPREFMTPDLNKIGAYVRAFKDKSIIPGIEVYSEKIVAVGSGR